MFKNKIRLKVFIKKAINLRLDQVLKGKEL